MSEPTAVVVVGGGPAGLATAAALGRHGVEAQVLDRGDTVGESWANRYARLHLHTPRVQSHLPGLRIPATMGRWVGRDDLVAYLQQYAAHHRLQVRLGVDVHRVERSAGGYRVLTGQGELTARSVVVATGYNQEPVLPDWPGASEFTGELLHAAAYRDGSVYRGLDVLVVGGGNSGAEIAADLAEHGARSVRLAIRTPPQIVPRQIGPVPTTLLGILNDLLPAPVVDPVNRLLQRVTVGDLTGFGVGRPSEGLVAQMRRTDVVPTIDVGLLSQLRLGTVRVVPAVVALHPDRVQLADGQRVRADVVIAATGYRRTLPALVGHLGVLSGDRPLVKGGRTSPWAPDLYFVGLANALKGLLLQINLDARAVARAISARERASAR
ncbi:cation diffusion facilitator CzcD-associated flavoprotein CzcO [Microlunatus panaciterrae]|uniref:Cation diffusion facilitator CzcD-associated flavoprotein CzcO n=1 Tax=Microlunatus panaciterrae TaxID=400768 RepID=A0ABS2RME2_9ACTN|nr:cation diffusion facilitator CzcD-associated flavoprotein CzcO [Microlunatus panaciterrae]